MSPSSELLVVCVEPKRYDGGPVTVRARGEVCTASAARLRRALDEALAEQPTALMLDLSGVTFLDGRGLQVLLDVQRRLDERSALLCLVNPARPVRRVLELTGTDGVFAITDEQSTGTTGSSS